METGRHQGLTRVEQAVGFAVKISQFPAVLPTFTCPWTILHPVFCMCSEGEDANSLKLCRNSIYAMQNTDFVGQSKQKCCSVLHSH